MNSLERHVRKTFESLPEQVCSVSVITLLEIEKGILQIERRDGMQAMRLRKSLDQVEHGFSGRIQDITAPVARQCARLHVPDPRPPHDALIAATALVHGLTLVTRNVADFRGISGLRIMNPWSA